MKAWDFLLCCYSFVYVCIHYRHIYDIYVNLYNTSFSGQSAETIAKVKGFYQEQVRGSAVFMLM